MFKIFVGNLPPTVTVEALHHLFSRYLPIEDIALPVEEGTGKLRGFAIVMTKDEIRGRASLAQMRGVRLDGRALVINAARKKGKAPPSRGGSRRPGGMRRGGRVSGEAGAAGPGSGRSFGRRPYRGSGGGYGGSGGSGGAGGSGGSGGGGGRSGGYGDRPDDRGPRGPGGSRPDSDRGSPRR